MSSTCLVIHAGESQGAAGPEEAGQSKETRMYRGRLGACAGRLAGFDSQVPESR